MYRRYVLFPAKSIGIIASAGITPNVFTIKIDAVDDKKMSDKNQSTFKGDVFKLIARDGKADRLIPDMGMSLINHRITRILRNEYPKNPGISYPLVSPEVE